MSLTPASELIHEGREHARRVLLGNAGPLGSLPGARAQPKVWTRDSMIAGLALMLCGPEGHWLHRRSLDTLGQHQDRLGKIPHNVGHPGGADPGPPAPGSQGPSDDAPRADTAHAGSIDDCLWYLLGQDHAFALGGDADVLGRDRQHILAAYRWLEYQDVNGCGLLEAHEAMDWGDVLGNRYATLYANVLWFAVHRAMARIAGALGDDTAAGRYLELAGDIRFKINTLLWVGPEWKRDTDWMQTHRKEWLPSTRLIDTVLVERPFYLPYVAFRGYGDRLDSLGNLLAVLLGVADERQSARILDYVRAAGVDEPWPVRALDHPVQPGDGNWREFGQMRSLNQPEHHRNGGAWPFLGGFYVAALVAAGRQEEAERQLLRLAEMNRRTTNGKDDDWEFNQWLHGRSGRPMGFPGQTASAGMFLFAAECVARRAVPGLWDAPPPQPRPLPGP